MSGCCEDGTCQLPPEQPIAHTCPRCGHAGRRVDTQTVKALINVSLRAVREDTAYYFCRTADCEVVYYSENRRQIFGTSDVRERVYQKEPGAGDAPVCYCFRYTVDSVRADPDSALDDINAGIAAGNCACDIRNPQGSCCLGNVRAVVKAAGFAPQDIR